MGTGSTNGLREEIALHDLTKRADAGSSAASEVRDDAVQRCVAGKKKKARYDGKMQNIGDCLIGSEIR